MKSVRLPKIFLILENLTIFIAALLGYYLIQGKWWLFFLLLLSPDIFMLGYPINPKIGSIVYNIGHVYVWGIVLIAMGVFLEANLARELGLIWVAHIGMDRVMGYGLKYPGNFKDTHFQKI